MGKPKRKQAAADPRSIEAQKAHEEEKKLRGTITFMDNMDTHLRGPRSSQ